jgi:hypothetical protein
MPFRTSSGSFGAALRPGLSAGTLRHVILRGMDERILGSGLFVARMLAAGAGSQPCGLLWFPVRCGRRAGG